MSSHCLSLQYFHSPGHPGHRFFYLIPSINPAIHSSLFCHLPIYPSVYIRCVYCTCLPYLYKSHVCPPSISSVFHLCVHPVLYSICHFSLNLSVCHSITISSSVTVVTVSDICLLLSLAVREVKLLRRQTETCLEAVLLEKHPCSKFILAVGSNATGKRQCQG